MREAHEPLTSGINNVENSYSKAVYSALVGLMGWVD